MLAHPVPSAEEVRDNAAFGALMAALARPGTLHDLPPADLPPLATLALALVDLECAVMTDDDALGRRLASTGARLVPAARADHAFLVAPDAALATLAALPVGSALYPDAGATMVLPARFGDGPELRLSGPGIDGTLAVRIGGLPAGFLDLRAVRCRYPEGVEILFLDGRRLMALPRSTSVEFR